MIKETFVDIIKHKIHRTNDYLVIFFLSLIPIWQMHLLGVWNKTDYDFPIRPLNNFYQNLFLWNDYSFGYSVTASHFIDKLDVSFFLAMLELLHFHIGIIQKIYLFTLFFALGSGIYYLITNISPFHDEKSTRRAALFGAILYIFNPYVIYRLNYGTTVFIEALAAAPFAITFLYLGYRSATDRITKETIRYLFLFNISALFLLTTHFALTLLFSMVFLSLATFFVITNQFSKASLKFTFLGLIMFISMNLWWILPRVFTLFFTQYLDATYMYSRPELIVIDYPNAEEQWVQHSKETLVHRVLYLQPFFSIENLPKFAPKYWGIWLNSVFSVLTGFIIVAIVFIPILFHNRNKKIIGVSLITIFFITLSLGSITQVGKLWLWLICNVPIPFSVVHVPERFSNLLLLGYAYLFGAGIAILYDKFHVDKNKTAISKLFTPLIILLIIVYAFPLFTGNLSGLMTTFEVPEYYYDANNWLEEEGGDFRVIEFPSYEWIKMYSWNPKYDMAAIEKNVFTRSVIYSRITGGPEPEESVLFKNLLYENMNNFDDESLSILLDYANVKYVMVSDDLMNESSFDNYQVIDTSQTKKNLDKSEHFTLEKRFGNLTFYKNEKYTSNLVYPVVNTLLVEEKYTKPSFYGLQTIPLISSSSKNGIFLEGPLKTEQQIKFRPDSPLTLSNSTTVNVEYRKVNPSMYKVKVHSDGPFILVFSSSYDNQWKAYPSAINWYDALHMKPIDNENHFNINGFMNAWYIDKEGDYELTLFYYPQITLNIGLILFILTFLSTSLFLIYNEISSN